LEFDSPVISVEDAGIQKPASTLKFSAVAEQINKIRRPTKSGFDTGEKVDRVV